MIQINNIPFSQTNQSANSKVLTNQSDSSVTFFASKDNQWERHAQTFDFSAQSQDNIREGRLLEEGDDLTDDESFDVSDEFPTIRPGDDIYQVRQVHVRDTHIDLLVNFDFLASEVVPGDLQKAET